MKDSQDGDPARDACVRGCVVVARVRKLAYNLKLFGIHESFERHAEEAATSSLHPHEFLKLILEEETLFRKNRKADALLNRAKFRITVDIEDWDSTIDRGINKAVVRGLSRLDFFHKRHNLILLGATGRGKTHLATAIGRQLCQGGYSTQFMPVSLLFEEVQAHRASGKYLAFLKRLGKLDVLILDDFGLRQYNHSEGTFLIDLLEHRAREGVHIMTSQIDPASWKTLFEDPVIADAITDRIVNPSTQLTITGDSYRKRLKEEEKSLTGFLII